MKPAASGRTPTNKMILLFSVSFLLLAGCVKDAEQLCETWSITTAYVILKPGCGGSTFINTDTLTYCNSSIPRGVREMDTVNRRLAPDSCYETYEVWNKRIQ